ncbi:alpha/beta hydrolase [Herbiconiux moechotypicola]|uniref:Alpha/beta hydrolase n=1 Tax=Herbiconiux moechotypicola TaxID=637393 RepID=A0ABN3DCY3_9MICO|nr:alpha/beta hydrolase [Herbiconiux moechotypicola]MCS5728677.1 alpha/beta hydrolase [Herbiconiux moechotypicola]
MTEFVLIHGSWHDGALWEPVATHLRDAGHTVHTPTVAGHGVGVDKAVDHADCVASIVDWMLEADLSDVVLLGHSYGGTIIARVFEEIPERIRRLVFWNAFVPAPGNSLLDEVPPHYRELFSQLAAASDDNTVSMPFPIWREAFIQDAPLELAQSTFEQLSSEPFQPFVDKLPLTRFYELLPTVGRSYINATEDTALPPGEWGWHPRMSGRLLGARLVQLPGSHEVMFTAPALLAQKIIEAGRD